MNTLAQEVEDLVAENARLRKALRDLIDRYDEVVTTPDCSCSICDDAVMKARAALAGRLTDEVIE